VVAAECPPPLLQPDANTASTATTTAAGRNRNISTEPSGGSLLAVVRACRSTFLVGKLH